MGSRELNGSTAAALMLLAAVIFGFMGVFTRVLEEAGFDAMQITFYRQLITALCVVLLIFLMDRTAFRIKREDLWVFIVLGVSKATMDFMFIGSQMYIPLSLASALQMTAPLFVILIMWLFFKNRITKVKWLSVAACLIGVMLMAGVVPDSFVGAHVGIIAGLIGAVAVAVYMLVSKHLLNKGYSVMTVLLYAFVIGLVCVTPFTDVPDTFEKVSMGGEIVWYLMGLGIVCTMVPYYLNIVGVKYLNTVTASVIQTTEIISSAVAGAFLFGESIGLIDIVGMVLIFASVFLIGSDERASRKEASAG